MRNLTYCAVLTLAITASASSGVHAQDRQHEVAQRGAAVMPFALGATTHVFSKTKTGGSQRVVAKSGSDTIQIQRIRAHLQEITAQFSRGDFSGPMQIHGEDMPGLAELRAAPLGRIAMTYRELPAGAEIVYTTADPALVTALHRWFAAQLTDHGHDAVAGDDHAKHQR
jgi:hypothetical protein